LQKQESISIKRRHGCFVPYCDNHASKVIACHIIVQIRDMADIVVNEEKQRNLEIFMGMLAKTNQLEFSKEEKKCSTT
jgi:hypothetical protein